MKRTLHLSVLFGFFILPSLASCPQPLPPTPPGPTPVADAAPLADRFAGGIFDCTLLDTTQWRPYVETCADAGNVGPCVNDYAATMTDPTPLICAARDVEVEGFVAIAKGAAGPEQEARARALRAWLAWLASTGTTLRSAP